jgi:hypothetical protein
MAKCIVSGCWTFYTTSPLGPFGPLGLLINNRASEEAVSRLMDLGAVVTDHELTRKYDNLLMYKELFM